MQTEDDKRETFLHDIREVGDRHAKAKGERVYLDEFKKSKLAVLMKRYEAVGHSSAVAQEREARADAEYLELLDGLRAAVEEEQRTFWELKVAEYRFESWRSRLAMKRAEMSRYGAGG